MHKKLRNIFYTFIIGYPLYAISFLFPRKKGRWIFGTGDKFFDNSKYLFIEVTEKHPNIDATWLTSSVKLLKFLHSKGIKAYKLNSLKGYYYLLTANIYVSSYHSKNDLPIWFMGRAKHINLWHGVGIKNIAFKSSVKHIYNGFHHPILKYLYAPLRFDSYKKPTLFLSPSSYMSEHFKQCFRLTDKHILKSTYPRCALLNWSEKQLLNHIERYEPKETKDILEEIKQYNHVYIYMPTWRDNNPNYLQSSNINFQKLNNLLSTKNEIMLLKLHPATPYSNLNSIKGLSNILTINDNIDIYPILPFTDTLITDYSSIYYDYLLMDKKRTIFFIFDYEEYKQSRDLTMSLLEAINGEIAYTFSDLLQVITNYQHSYNPEKRNELLNMFWGVNEKKEDIIERIKEIDQ